MAVSGSARLDALLRPPIVVDTAHQENGGDTARLDVVLRCQPMPLLQLLLAATGVVTLIVICHRRGFRGDSPGMDLATLDTRDGRRRI
jgi:hypothetical protein